MSVKAAFLFVAPEVDRAVHHAEIQTPVAHLSVIGVKNYLEGVEEARKLAERGVSCIELCAGFGSLGVAMVSKAVKGKAAVGVVRFDVHPGFDFKSGDEFLGEPAEGTKA